MPITLRNLHELLTSVIHLGIVDVVDAVLTEKRWAEGRALTDTARTLGYANYVGQLERFLSFLDSGVLPPGVKQDEARVYLPLIDRLTANGLFLPDARSALAAFTSSGPHGAAATQSA